MSTSKRLVIHFELDDGVGNAPRARFPKFHTPKVFWKLVFGSCHTLEAMMFGEADAAEEVSPRFSAEQFSTMKLRRNLWRNMISVLVTTKSCPPRSFGTHACSAVTFAASRRIWRCVRAVDLPKAKEHGLCLPQGRLSATFQGSVKRNAHRMSI